MSLYEIYLLQHALGRIQKMERKNKMSIISCCKGVFACIICIPKCIRLFRSTGKAIDKSTRQYRRPVTAVAELGIEVSSFASPLPRQAAMPEKALFPFKSQIYEQHPISTSEMMLCFQVTISNADKKNIRLEQYGGMLNSFSVMFLDGSRSHKLAIVKVPEEYEGKYSRHQEGNDLIVVFRKSQECI